jgi:isoquinoline 1-oxidoreductase beta subunit
MNRRQFLKTAAASALTIRIGAPAFAAEEAAAPTPSPLRWVRISSDGSVTVLSNTSEIGQGTGTAIAQILADELDLDWKRITLAMAPVEPAYFNAGWGEYGTYGSGGVAGQFEALRRAGAQARARLIAAAAERWKVAPGECDTSAGSVVHARTKRKLAYASLVARAAAMPEITDAPLMPRERWRHIGHEAKRLDIPAKVNGQAQYGIDVRVPGMAVAAIRQSPRFGGRLASVDPAPAMAVKGVIRVVRLDDAVAVVASSYWIAQKGLAALTPQWDDSKASSATSPAHEDSLVAAAREGGTVRVRKDSTLEKTMAPYSERMAKAASTVEAIYTVPYLAHATMEPMNATARVTAGSAELWLPTQDQGTAIKSVAKALGLAESAITLHTTFCGGGFGRRLEPDFAVQAARIAKDAGVPVKLIWSREEDMRHDFYRPAAAVKLSAGVGSDGKLVALRFDSACESLLKYSREGAFAQYIKPVDVSAIGEMPVHYGVPIIAAANTVDVDVPVGFWRSVAQSQNGFAFESLMDELAHKAGTDPVAYRRSLLSSDPRALRVLDAAAERAGWAGAAPAGRHRGVALVHANATRVALVVELSVTGDSRVTLHRVCAAVDCGLAVNPSSVRAQMEGGIAFGLSATFFGEITLENGAVRQSNFHDYRLVSMAQMPLVDVVIVPSEEKPTGVGEEAVGPVAAAVANAIFSATGKRVRSLPLARSGFMLA